MRRFAPRHLKKTKWPSRRKPRPKAEKNGSYLCDLKNRNRQAPSATDGKPAKQDQGFKSTQAAHGLAPGTRGPGQKKRQAQRQGPARAPSGTSKPLSMRSGARHGPGGRAPGKVQTQQHAPQAQTRWQTARLQLHALRAALWGQKSPEACCVQCGANAPKVASTARPKPAENSASWAGVNA